MDDINKHISTAVKSLRKALGWSLDKAARETGVSKAMLGQIERGESSPTVSTLWKIATGFDVSFSAFFALGESSQASLPCGETLEAMQLQDGGMRVVPMFPFDAEIHCEIFLIELDKMREHLSFPHKPGVIEHVIVVEGSLEVLFDGAWQALQKNQGLRFHAHQLHGYRNHTAKTAVFYNILHYPHRPS